MMGDEQTRLEGSGGLEGARGLESPRTRGLDPFETLRRPPVPVSRPWGPVMPEFQETIQIRNPRVGSSFFNHPFRLSIVDDELLVEFGVVYRQRIYADAGSRKFITWEEAPVTVGASGLNGGPDGLTGGTIALTPATAHGVWFEFPWIGPEAGDKTSAAVGGEWVTWGHSGLGDPVVVVNTTHTTAAALASIMAANNNKSYIFIGTITDAGVIKQHLRSEVWLAGISLPNQISSSELPNAIVTSGVDGGLRYDDVASPD